MKDNMPYGVIVFIGILFACPTVFAQTTRDFSSASVISQTASDFSFGDPGYPDSIFVEGYASGGGTVTVLSTTTPYTIISEEFVATPDYGDTSFCGSGGSTVHDFQPYASSWTLDYNSTASFVSYNRSIQFHCSNTYKISMVNPYYYAIQYVPYDTRVVSTSTVLDQPTYRDWLIVVQWIVFLLAILAFPIFFSMWSKSKR
jgi:hypothetical protein